MSNSTSNVSRPVGLVASAVNGQRGIGSGFDCDVVRTADGALLVCVTEICSGREWMMEQRERDLDEKPRDPQRVADLNAANPELSDPCWVAQPQDGDEEDAEWNRLAALWNAAREAGK